MQYRPEIDGLRALAVVPVILFHAGFGVCSGGFVGVDVFFVISGYLITSIILAELGEGRFSVLRFYARRARRILPALFVVIAASSVAAYAWMMPDEFKNFGQSVVATTLFSNNILLALTSGYWALASEFKPLLHTWSLGVEEQYYICFPVLMLIGGRYAGEFLAPALAVFAAVLLGFAVSGWGALHNPDMAFYLIQARAWELLVGSLLASRPCARAPGARGQLAEQALSLLGFGLIVGAVLAFGERQSTPGLYTLIPTGGAALVIRFATPRTTVGRLLGAAPLVGIGLVSYSAYLWHQPLLAFARIYSVNPPGALVNAALVPLTFLLAFLTWKYVERPCRNKALVGDRAFLGGATAVAAAFVAFGLYLDASYGMPYRVFDQSFRREEMDKRLYNERVFAFKKDSFAAGPGLRVLVIGNSFGRDFVNMTLENVDARHTRIVYRDDLAECIYPYQNEVAARLYAAADVIVFASGTYQRHCIGADIAYSGARGKSIFYVGTKGFGYNLNWLVRVGRERLPNQFNPLPAEVLATERAMAEAVPADHYISLLAPIVRENRVPITDPTGQLISSDRVHLTRAGAEFVGERALLPSRYGSLLLTGS